MTLTTKHEVCVIMIKGLNYSVSSRLLLNHEFSLVDTVNDSTLYTIKDKMIIWKRSTLPFKSLDFFFFLLQLLLMLLEQALDQKEWIKW